MYWMPRCCLKLAWGPACNQTIAVLAPKALRLRRIMERDSLTEEQARARIQSQPADEFYRERVCMCWDGQEKAGNLAPHGQGYYEKGKGGWPIWRSAEDEIK